MKVTIEQMPELRLGAVRHVGPYMGIGRAFARLGEIVEKSGVARTSDMAMLGVFHDDPRTTAESELRSDAALTFPADARIPKGLEERRLPAGRYARTTHIGPYEGLGDVWARLRRDWLAASGEQPANRPSFEIYRNTPETVPKQELRTDLFMPLR